MTTTTREQLTKNILKSLRKGYKRSQQKAAQIASETAKSHKWHFGTCLDCGISANRAENDECNGRG